MPPYLIGSVFQEVPTFAGTIKLRKPHKEPGCSYSEEVDSKECNYLGWFHIQQAVEVQKQTQKAGQMIGENLY